MNLEHRNAVLVHLMEQADPKIVTPEAMAAARPELPVARWARVLDAMARVGAPRVNGAGRSIPPARLLHVVAGDPDTVTYALAPDGWAAARRLCPERGAA